METVLRVLPLLTLVLILLTTGCGLTIRYGGEAFKNALTGHMGLGVATLALAVTTTVVVFKAG